MPASRLRPSPAMVVACTSLVLSMGGVGYAATGGTFVLGSANKAANPTSLTSKSTSGSTLVVSNKGGAPAAGFKTQDGAPPFVVNRDTKVDKLNADLLDGVDSSGFVRADEDVPAASVNSTVGQVAPTVAQTTLSANSEQFDQGNLWEPAGDATAFTVPRDGTYVVSATVEWQPNGNGYRRVDLETNGGNIASALGPANSPAYTTQNVSGIASLVAGQKVRVLATQGSGSSLQVRLLQFQIAYVGR